MGPLFQIIFWFILFFGLGIIISIGLLIPVTVYKKKKNSDFRFSTKVTATYLAFIFAFSIVTSIGGTGYIIYDIESSRNDYWKYDGGWEFYRMPLEYPYELWLDGSLRTASLERWQSNKKIAKGITSYLIIDHVMLGKMNDDQMFLFEFGNGNIQHFDNADSFNSKLKELQILEPGEFLPVRTHFTKFMDSK